MKGDLTWSTSLFHFFFNLEEEEEKKNSFEGMQKYGVHIFHCVKDPSVQPESLDGNTLGSN